MNELGPNSLVGLILFVSVILFVIMAFSRRFLLKIPPMLPVPVQSVFLYSTYFTAGIALLCVGWPFLVPTGISLSVLGLSIFLPEKVVLRFLGAFIILLGLSLIAFLQRLHEGNLSIELEHGLPSWYAGGALLVWGFGIWFAWIRWYSVRCALKEKEGTPPPLSIGGAGHSPQNDKSKDKSGNQ